MLIRIVRLRRRDQVDVPIRLDIQLLQVHPRLYREVRDPQ